MRVVTWVVLFLFAVQTASAAEPVRLGEGNLLTGIPGSGPLSMKEIQAWLAVPSNHVELQPVLPLGLAQGVIVGI